MYEKKTAAPTEKKTAWKTEKKNEWHQNAIQRLDLLLHIQLVWAMWYDAKRQVRVIEKWAQQPKKNERHKK